MTTQIQKMNACSANCCCAIGVTGCWKFHSHAACASEGYAVAKAKGVKLGFSDPVAYVRDFGSKIPNARPSMLLDLMAKRRSEIDAINGGTMAGAITQNPVGIGAKCVEAAAMALQGLEVPEKIDTGFLWADAETIETELALILRDEEGLSGAKPKATA